MIDPLLIMPNLIRRRPGQRYIGLVDKIAGVTCIAAHSAARQLRAAYTGPLVRLRRSTDNAERDFYPAPKTGLLDAGEVATWAGAGSVTVVTLYSQIGAEHLTQSTAANQPAFVGGGVNGRPGIQFDGTNDRLLGPAVGTLPFIASGMAVYFVARSANASARYVIDYEDSTHSFINNYVAGKWEWYSSPRTQIANSSTSIFQVIGFNNASTPAAPVSMVIGGNEDFGDYWAGIIPEVVTWQTSPTAGQIAIIQSDMREFYGAS